MKDGLGLRSEPVAVKLVGEGEEFPAGYSEPEGQQSHCQAVMGARKGNCYKMPAEKQSCVVGSSTLGMAPVPEKVASGEFHANMGVHEDSAAAGRMIAERVDIPYKTAGEIVCPLAMADFEPDVVIVVDVPERIFWLSAANVYDGGRSSYTTAPFQCACEDVTAIPMMTGRANISMGCVGCRRRTDMALDEMAIGFPFSMMPKVEAAIDKFGKGALARGRKE